MLEETQSFLPLYFFCEIETMKTMFLSGEKSECEINDAIALVWK